jgi:hypothetical protein
VGIAHHSRTSRAASIRRTKWWAMPTLRKSAVIMNLRINRLLIVAALSALPGWLGCEAAPKNQYASIRLNQPGAGVAATPPKTIDPTIVDTHDNIVQIVALWRQFPFLKNGDEIVGIVPRVYFVESGESKGAFVDGPIGAELHLLERDRDGRMVRGLAHEWKLDRATAMGLRIRKVSTMGYSYGMPLRWPADMDLGGRQVEVVFTYTRADGHVIRSSAKRMRVPLSTGVTASRTGG